MFTCTLILQKNYNKINKKPPPLALRKPLWVSGVIRSLNTQEIALKQPCKNHLVNIHIFSAPLQETI